MDKGHVKNQLHQIILAIYLTDLMLKGFLVIDLFEVQSNDE